MNKEEKRQATILREYYEEVSKPAANPEEKYNQLRAYFDQCSKNPQKQMELVINHALVQSELVGGYLGFSHDFWLQMILEDHKYNRNVTE